MVKVGKRFFFDKKNVKKNHILTIVTISVIITLIISTFLITRYFYDTSIEKGKVIIKVKDKIESELFSPAPDLLSYFETIYNVPLNKIEISYDESLEYTIDDSKCSEEEKNKIKSIQNGDEKDFNLEKDFKCINFLPQHLGNYPVKIKIYNEEYESTLAIIDKTAPKITLKEITINNEENYSANDFVLSCEDNSQEECYASFYNPEKGKKIDYSKYKEPGEYEIKIVAKDSSGNTSEPQTTKLTITEVKYYTVAFNSNGGTKVESQTVREGEYARSAYPNRDGYTFEGWYQNNTKYNFNTPIYSNITLTASWKKIPTYTPPGGGSNSGSGSGSGNSSGNGGSSKTGCTYGTYNDYVSDLSMKATLINGKSQSDCAELNSGESDKTYQSLKKYAQNIINNLTSNTGKLNKDIRTLYGTKFNLLFESSINGISNSKGGFMGVSIKIKAINNSTGNTLRTYTLYNCTTTSCSYY